MAKKKKSPVSKPVSQIIGFRFEPRKWYVAVFRDTRKNVEAVIEEIVGPFVGYDSAEVCAKKMYKQKNLAKNKNTRLGWLYVSEENPGLYLIQTRMWHPQEDLGTDKELRA